MFKAGSKKFLKFIILILAGVALGSILTNKLARVGTIQKDVVSSEKGLNRNSFAEIAKDARPSINLQWAADQLKADADFVACQEAYADLLNIKITNDSELNGLPRSIKPCPLENGPLVKLRDFYHQECADPKNIQSCTNAFVLFRASANSWLHKDANIADIDDLRTLADILMGSAGEGNIDRFEQAAVRMRELAPQMYEPLKANIIAKIMKASSLEERSDSREFSNVISALERDIEEAKMLPQVDPELQEAIILAATRMGKERDRMDRIVQELKSSGQSGPTLDYYEAAVLWKNGRKDEALSQMRKLVKENQQNERFSETLKKLESNPDESQKSFESRLSLNFDFLSR